jgi:hypothetical protein
MRVLSVPDAYAPRSDLHNNAFRGGVPNAAAIAFAAGMPILCVAYALNVPCNLSR